MVPDGDDWSEANGSDGSSVRQAVEEVSWTVRGGG